MGKDAHPTNRAVIASLANARRGNLPFKLKSFILAYQNIKGITTARLRGLRNDVLK